MEGDICMRVCNDAKCREQNEDMGQLNHVQLYRRFVY